MAIPQHYRALLGLHMGPDEVSHAPLMVYDPALGALGWGFFKKAFKAVGRVAKAVVKAPVAIAKTVVKAVPKVVTGVAKPMFQAAVGIAKNPLSAKSWTNLVTAPVKSVVNAAGTATHAAFAVTKDALVPIKTAADVTGASALGTKIAQVTKLDKVGNAIATGAAIATGVVNAVAEGAGAGPLLPSPLPRTPEAEQLAEDVAYVEQQEQVAEAMANAADAAASAGDVQATAVLGERARDAAKNAQEGQKDVVGSAKAALDAGNSEANVAAAIAMVKARAGAEAKNVIAKVAADAKAGTLPPGMSPASAAVVDVSPRKPGAAGKAMGAGAGALIGTMFFPGIGTVVGAAAGFLFGAKADVEGARKPLVLPVVPSSAPATPPPVVQKAVAGLSGRRLRARRAWGLGGVQWDPSAQQWRYR